MDNALNKLDEVYARKPKIELYRDNFQNYKRYGIPKAQLVIADIPYNIGADAYGSNPMWYKGGNPVPIVYNNKKGIYQTMQR